MKKIMTAVLAGLLLGGCNFFKSVDRGMDRLTGTSIEDGLQTTFDYTREAGEIADLQDGK